MNLNLFASSEEDEARDAGQDDNGDDSDYEQVPGIGDESNIEHAPGHMRNDSDVQHGHGDKCDDASDIGPVEHDPNGDNGVSYEEPHYGALEGEDIETAGIRIIPLYSMSTTMQDLKKAVAKYGLAFGFQVCSSGWSFTCNKAGFTRQRRNGNIPEEKQRQGSRHLKVGCSMCVKFSLQDKTLDGKVDKSGRVRVTYSKFAHSSTCTPSANQLVVCRRASGDYSKLSQAMVASILSVLKNDPGVSTRALHAMLAPAFPKHKHISALEIFNMKVRVKLMHEETKKMVQQVNIRFLWKSFLWA